MMEFHKGDIVVNINTSENNRYHRSMYLGKTGKTYKVIHFDGSVAHIYCKNIFGDSSLQYEGHMKEYDIFKKALRALGEVSNQEKDEV